MMRKDMEEERQTQKKKWRGALLAVTGVLVVLTIIVITCKKSSHSNLENGKQVEAQETEHTQTQEEVTEATTQMQETQNGLETESQESMWEDNGPDERDVPEDVDAAYQQEAAQTIQTTEEQGGTE